MKTVKKLFVAAFVLFLIVSLNSCKLFGLDDESILAKEPWNGDKAEVYDASNGDFIFSVSLSGEILDFNKKTHRYEYYDDDSGDRENGDWSYDKKNKILTLDPDDDEPVDFEVTELSKKALNMKTNFDLDEDGVDDWKVVYIFKRD